MRKAIALRLMLASLLVLFLVSGCLPKPKAAINCASDADYCIGLVTDLGKVDDYGINQMTWEGLKKAELKLGVHVQYIETTDSRDYDKNIATFAKAHYDLIVTVGYDQIKPTLDAAQKYPDVHFLGVDQFFGQDKALPQNLAGIYYAEDHMGFLAGVLAAHLTRFKKVGAVCGPDTFDPAWRYCEGFKAGVEYVNFPPTPTETATETPEPDAGEKNTTPKPPKTPKAKATSSLLMTPTPTITPEETAEEISYRWQDATATPSPEQSSTPSTDGTETPSTLPTDTPSPTVEALVVYHNDLAFKESIADPTWDASAANNLMKEDVDVIFGADSFGENGAVSAAAKLNVFAIGVNTDQYYTVTDAQAVLISSAMKQVADDVFEFIRKLKVGFSFGDHLGTAAYAPYHDLEDRLSGTIKGKLKQVQLDLASDAIELNVPPSKPSQ